MTNLAEMAVRLVKCSPLATLLSGHQVRFTRGVIPIHWTFGRTPPPGAPYSRDGIGGGWQICFQAPTTPSGAVGALYDDHGAGMKICLPNQCEPNPCTNGGTCTPSDALTTGGGEAAAFVCACPTRTSGVTCDGCEGNNCASQGGAPPRVFSSASYVTAEMDAWLQSQQAIGSEGWTVCYNSATDCTDDAASCFHGPCDGFVETVSIARNEITDCSGIGYVDDDAASYDDGCTLGEHIFGGYVCELLPSSILVPSFKIDVQTGGIWSLKFLKVFLRKSFTQRRNCIYPSRARDMSSVRGSSARGSHPCLAFAIACRGTRRGRFRAEGTGTLARPRASSLS